MTSQGPNCAEPTLSTPEGVVKDAIKKWLKKQVAWFFMPVSNGMGVHGIPDFLAAMPLKITPEMVGMTIGVFVGIEAKAPKKRDNTTARQRMQLLALEKTGAIAAVISCDLEIQELEEHINAIAAGTKSTCLPFEKPFKDSGCDTVESDGGSQRGKPRRRATPAGRNEGAA